MPERWREPATGGWSRIADGILWLTLDRADSGVNALSAAVLEELERLLPGLARSRARGLVHPVRQGRRLHRRRRHHRVRRPGRRRPGPGAHPAGPGGVPAAGAAAHAHSGHDPRVLPGRRPGAGPGLPPPGGLGRPGHPAGLARGPAGHPSRASAVPCGSLRLLGPARAMDLMLTGRTLSAQAARKLGLVDAVVPERHLARAAAEPPWAPPPRAAVPGAAPAGTWP